MTHYKVIPITIKCSIDTKYYLYQMKPDGNLSGTLNLHAYSDADCVRDNII